MPAEAFGLALPSALLAPQFVRQAAESRAFARQAELPLTPLEDLKEWLRQERQAGRGGEHAELLGLLLADEDAARSQALESGELFDQLEYEMGALEADDSYGCFEPDGLARLLELVLDRGDELAAWAELELAGPLSLAVGLCLPPLPAGGGRRLAPQLLEASLNLDLHLPGKAPALDAGSESGVLAVPLQDPRVGDRCSLSLYFVYPLALQGHFMRAADALAASMSLKPEA
jgi:hypothetical protein